METKYGYKKDKVKIGQSVKKLSSLLLYAEIFQRSFHMKFNYQETLQRGTHD
jgi:hypothetical protein